MAIELRQETELRRTGVSEALPRVETALAASKEDNDALQNQLEVLKAASTSKAEDAETQQQTVEELQIEKARFRSTHAAETERADSAEAAARAGQEEVHRLCSGGEDALQQTEAALTAAKQENDALQAELDQVKADSASNAAAREGEQRQAAATRAELQQAQSNHAAERQRADAAETAAKQSQEEAERLRSGEDDALQQSEAALAAARQEKEALQAELQQAKSDLTSNAAAGRLNSRRLLQYEQNLSDRSQRIWLNPKVAAGTTDQRAAVEAAAAAGEQAAGSAEEA